MEYRGSYDMTVKINNVSAGALDYDYLVARPVEGELWYYGAMPDEDGAMKMAKEVDGIVMKWSR